MVVPYAQFENFESLNLSKFNYIFIRVVKDIMIRLAPIIFPHILKNSLNQFKKRFNNNYFSFFNKSKEKK
jgi:hypothetical protein